MTRTEKELLLAALKRLQATINSRSKARRLTAKRWGEESAWKIDIELAEWKAARQAVTLRLRELELADLKAAAS